MGLTTAALVRPQTRRFNNTQKSCQIAIADTLYNQTSARAGQQRVPGRIHKMNVQKPAPTSYPVGKFGQVYSGATCAGHTPKNTPPKGGAKILICGGCGLRNINPTITIPLTDCCKECGSHYNFGNGSQETTQIFKDTVKGNRGAFACGGTNKNLGVYGSGSVVTREYTVAPTSIPGFVAPTNKPSAPVFVVQPPPAVKSVTVPARKNYSFSTSELIKQSGIGYDANLAIRGCGTRRPCLVEGGEGTCKNCVFGADVPCQDRSYFADGICPGGLTSGGQSCTTGKEYGGKRGSCECLSWTYKRNNAEFAHQGAVDASLHIARQERLTQVAEECNTMECRRLEGQKEALFGSCNDCVGKPCSGLISRTAKNGVRRVPQELHRPGMRRVRF